MSDYLHNEQWLEEVNVLANAIAKEDPQTVSAIICFALARTNADFWNLAVTSRSPSSGMTRWIRQLGQAQVAARVQARNTLAELARKRGIGA